MYEFKAQSSIEFVSVVAITVLLASPFILQAQQSLFETSSSTDLSRFESSLDNFIDTVERVDAMGEPARDAVRISVPNNIVDTEVKAGAIVYTRNSSSGLMNYTRLTEAKINEGDLPTKEGYQRVDIKAWNSGVNFTVNGFDDNPP